MQLPTAAQMLACAGSLQPKPRKCLSPSQTAHALRRQAALSGVHDCPVSPAWLSVEAPEETLVLSLIYTVSVDLPPLPGSPGPHRLLP